MEAYVTIESFHDVTLLLYDGCAHYWSAYTNGTLAPSRTSVARHVLSLSCPCHLDNVDNSQAAAPLCHVIKGRSPSLSSLTATAEKAAVYAAF